LWTQGSRTGEGGSFKEKLFGDASGGVNIRAEEAEVVDAVMMMSGLIPGDARGERKGRRYLMV
jgi:hypothetical protein